MWNLHRLGHAALGVIHVILSVILVWEGQVADALATLAAAIVYGVLTSGGHGKGPHHRPGAGDGSDTKPGST